MMLMIVLVLHGLVHNLQVTVFFIRGRSPSVAIQGSDSTIRHKSQEGNSGVHNIVPENAVKHWLKFVTGRQIAVEKERYTPTAESKHKVEQTYQQALHAFRRLSIDEFQPYTGSK